MILLLHGYLLEGSGSNLWTRAMVTSLCRIGETVHLMCQENHPEEYDFIAEARIYHPDGRMETVLNRDVAYPGRCVLHKPLLGSTLPVYVHDRYEEFSRVIPMVDLSETEIEEYMGRNIAVARRIVAEHPIHAVHANHAVLMPQVARRVAQEAGLPFTVMPHGSAIEYAVKRDPRFLKRAASAIEAAAGVFVIGPEMRRRVHDVFDGMADLDHRLVDLNLGVDTRLFQPVPPADRASAIRRLGDLVRRTERGRTPEDRRALPGVLSGWREADLTALLAEPPGDPKRPDAGLEAALDDVAWGEEPVLLFVGRLIAAKGPQAVLAALPGILQRRPGARLVVVGHGPLRLPLEAMVHALSTGDGPLLDALARTPFDGAPDGMPEVRAFLEDLRAAGELEEYLELARETVDERRVIFTGYLRHAELRHLFPCCDAAVFPSVVREAGPLVFLEALGCGVVPLGTDFGGMRESLNALEEVLPPEILDTLRLRPGPEGLVSDIGAGVPVAFAAAAAHGPDLRRLAEQRYDWTSVAQTFRNELQTAAT